MKKISVGIADLRIAQSPNVLISYGLGSCVGVALHDPFEKIGGLAHVMLPTASGIRTGDPLKYADSAIEMIVVRMVDAGCARGALLAKMAGGADMFLCSASDVRPKIGERNVEAVRAKLKELRIPLVAEDVGGNYGRTVELETATGVFTVRSVRLGSKRL
ncbi:MAG: chemotaxis protein CheD [Deltaproteobacteria bacterium RBG_13_65_10]|nr:MAG: chemotaxis protein CheD [Deltaproteobacteria bacterium RBG_13_65_10]